MLHGLKFLSAVATGVARVKLMYQPYSIYGKLPVYRSINSNSLTHS